MVRIPNRMVEEIRKDADARGANGSLSSAIVDYMFEAGLFKLFVPTALGGSGLTLPEALRVFEQASWADGSFGWLATIGSGGGFFSATLPSEQAQELFGHDKALVAGSGHPNGIAVPVEGGYLVSGRWQYCSGAVYASLFTANCRIRKAGGAQETGGVAGLARSGGSMGEDDLTSSTGSDYSAGEEAIRSFAFLPDQVRIVRDWNAFGMKATESHSIVVDNAFVPTERTFDIMSEPRFDDPIFRYPFLPFAQTSFAAVCLGVCRHFIEEARVFAEAREADWANSRPGRLAALRDEVEKGGAALLVSADRFYETVERTWDAFVMNGTLDEVQSDEVGAICKGMARDALAHAHMIFPLLGMTALMEDLPLNRIWRDLHTVAQHSALSSV
ncbi:acyl-CoA dehydrogenase family protein [Cohnella soli]|uniref:Acyl-CoA dehydrogenase family protein n=1 Tax=Cohnella soli TaxID=425005 RepID=A0ABW0I271_9BACL